VGILIASQVKHDARVLYAAFQILLSGQKCLTHACTNCLRHTSTTLADQTAVETMRQRHTAAECNLVYALQARVAISDARTVELQTDLRCRVVEVAYAAGQKESNPHLSSSDKSTASAVDSATGSTPASPLHTMPVSAADSAASLFSGPVPDSGADSAADCSNADCADSGAPSSVIQISADACGCTLAGTAGPQPSKQPSITAVIQPEDGSTAESTSKREPGAASDSAGIAAGANNPTAACGFLLEKQPSADVVEPLLQPSQHAESGISAQTEAQSVVAGASTVAADQKRSHRRNVVAFVSLHVATRLLRVMHR